MGADESFKDRGNAAYQAKDYDKAVDLYTEGIEHEPSNAVLFSNRSAAFLNLGLYDKAKRDADMCIELDPKWSKGWWRKGMALIENQEYVAARSTFNEGLRHCPGDSNLVGGIEKANKYIAVVESVQGGGEPEFDLDGKSTRDAPKDDDTSKRRQPETSGIDDAIPESEQPSSDNSNGKTQTNSSKPSPSKEAAKANTSSTTTAEAKDEEPWPGTPEVEIQRVLKAPNHYAVLHVSTDASNSDMKKNYYTLARMLHPDRCQLEGAGDAMTAVSQAYDTLTNVLKKTLYDQFLSQTGGENDEPNQTYQEWESRQQPVEIPKWLAFLLGIKGCGYILLFIFAIVMLPILVVLVLLYIVFTILCLPVSCFFRVFFPEKYARMKEREEREMAKVEEEAQDRMFAHV